MWPGQFRRCAATVGAVALLAVAVQPAGALENSYSNHQPGAYGDFFVALPPPRGFSARLESYYSTAASLESDDFDTFRIESDILQYTFELTYRLPGRVLGGRYAVSASLPLLDVDVDLQGDGFGESDRRTAVGDVAVVPVSLYWRFGSFRFNVYESVSIPISDVDASRLANPGVDYWSFDTNAAVTWYRRRRGIELSAVAGHTYNTKNRDTDYHSGQELHFDAMANRHFPVGVSLGVHAFSQIQITDDRGSGAPPGGFRVDASGVGPAVAWALPIGDRDVSLTLRWLHEVDARHRPTGENVYVTLAADL